MKTVVAHARLLCNICGRTWTARVSFTNLADIELHDFERTSCKCGAETCTILPPCDTGTAAAGFASEIDLDDPADAWKKEQ